MHTPLVRLLALFAAGSAAAGTTFTLTDHTGRGFAPDLVTYAVAGMPPFTVTDAAGAPVAVQVTGTDAEGRSLLGFVTDLPAGQSRSFTLSPGKTAAVKTRILLRREGNTLVLGNGLIAVRTPEPVDKSYRAPVKASSLPAPLLAFRSGTNDWLGKGSIRSPRPVKAWRVTQTAAGPVFAEILYELDYADGGFYKARIRVTDQVSAAVVTEEYDAGTFAAAPEEWELDLTRGWKPDRVETARCWGNGGVDTGRVIPLAEFTARDLISDGAWGAGTCSLIGLTDSARTNAGDTLVGVAPLRRGTWRRAMPLPLTNAAPGSLAIRLPMARTPAGWVELSPFSVVTHQDDLPATYARRQWGLVLAPPPAVIRGGVNGKVEVGPVYQARLTYGVIGLDRYKDFVLDWPDTGAAYPRLFMRTNTVAAFAAALDGPLGESLKKRHPLLAGQTNLFLQQLPRTLQGASHLALAAFGLPVQSHHSCSDVGPFMAAADDALAWPGLSAEDRRTLRARLALLAYLYTDPDTTGQGNGWHTGNPNMSMARQLWISGVLALLPDHPMAADWARYMAAFTEFKLADNMAPGGGWFEPGTYHMWAYERVMLGLAGLRRLRPPNLDRLLARHAADAGFYMNLLTPPDTRYGARMIPGFGNSATHYSAELLQAGGLLDEADPELAANLAWAWDANGRQAQATPAAAAPWVQPEEPALGSRLFPGFGVIFRAHQGPEETYLLLRSGHLWSHWTIDQGNVALYSKGAALLAPQPYTYFTTALTNFSQYNDIRFGSPAREFPFGWPDGNVLDYHFGKRAQYAWASAGYPAWHHPGGAFRWNRQVVFLPGRTPRSPNYFVFRDTFPGAGQPATFFNLDPAGTKDTIQTKGNRLTVKTEWPVSLDLDFAGKTELKPVLQEEEQGLNLQYNVYGPTFARATGAAPVSPNWFRKDGTPVDKEKLKVPDTEKRIHVRLDGKPGEDYFWVAYPRAEGETEARVERLSETVVKVTHPEGTDYILLSPTNALFDNGEVRLGGQAAAVRTGLEGATLCLLGGQGGIGYKQQTFRGVAPYEKPAVGNAASDHVETGNAGEVVIETRPDGVRFIAEDPVYAEASRGLAGVRGVGPFDLTFTATGITGRVSGKARNLVVSQPTGIARPMYHMDGERWLAAFPDSFHQGHGKTNLQFNLAFGVTDGAHTVEIREWRSPPFPAEVKRTVLR